MTKFSNIQKKLDKETNPLYLSNYKNEFTFGHWSMSDFILQFLVSLSSDNNTVDSVTHKITCKPSKRRSIGDIYNICRYYYNNVSLYEVQYILAHLCRKKEVGYFYCNSTKKRVYMSMEFYKSHSYNPIHYANPDEYNIEPDLIVSLSLKSIEEFV